MPTVLQKIRKKLIKVRARPDSRLKMEGRSVRCSSESTQCRNSIISIFVPMGLLYHFNKKKLCNKYKQWILRLLRICRSCSQSQVSYFDKIHDKSTATVAGLPTRPKSSTPRAAKMKKRRKKRRPRLPTSGSA